MIDTSKRQFMHLRLKHRGQREKIKRENKKEGKTENKGAPENSIRIYHVNAFLPIQKDFSYTYTNKTNKCKR